MAFLADLRVRQPDHPRGRRRRRLTVGRSRRPAGRRGIPALARPAACSLQRRVPVLPMGGTGRRSARRGRRPRVPVDLGRRRQAVRGGHSRARAPRRSGTSCCPTGADDPVDRRGRRPRGTARWTRWFGSLCRACRLTRALMPVDALRLGRRARLSHHVFRRRGPSPLPVGGVRAVAGRCSLIEPSRWPSPDGRYPVSTHRSRVLTRKGGKSWPRRTST